MEKQKERYQYIYHYFLNDWLNEISQSLPQVYDLNPQYGRTYIIKVVATGITLKFYTQIRNDLLWDEKAIW